MQDIDRVRIGLLRRRTRYLERVDQITRSDQPSKSASFTSSLAVFRPSDCLPNLKPDPGKLVSSVKLPDLVGVPTAIGFSTT